MNDNNFYCGSSSNLPCQLALKSDIPNVTEYVHPTEKQCNYVYTHPSAKQCNYSYVHPSEKQCSWVPDLSSYTSLDSAELVKSSKVTGNVYGASFTKKPKIIFITTLATVGGVAFSGIMMIVTKSTPSSLTIGYDGADYECYMSNISWSGNQLRYTLYYRTSYSNSTVDKPNETFLGLS